MNKLTKAYWCCVVSISMPLVLTMLPCAPPCSARGETGGITRGLPGRGSTVARVNSHVVMADEVYDAVGGIFERIDESYGAAEAERKKAEFFWMTVREVVLEHMAMDASQTLGVSVPDQEIEKELDRLAKKFGSAERVMEIYEKERGIPRKEVREKIKREVTAREVIYIRAGLRESSGKLGFPPADIFVSPQDIRQYYQENLSHYREPDRIRARFIIILFALCSSEADARELHERLVTALAAGEDFAELAKKHSHGPEAKNGGLWEDFIEEGTFSAAVEDALFATEPGQLGSVLVPGKGYYIFRVEEKQGGRLAPFSEVEEEIQETLLQKRINLATKKATQALVDEAFVWPENLFADEQEGN